MRVRRPGRHAERKRCGRLKKEGKDENEEEERGVEESAWTNPGFEGSLDGKYVRCKRVVEK